MNQEPEFNPEKGEGQMHEFPVMIDDTHKYTNVRSDAYVGPGNAHHHYLIENKEGTPFLGVRFQDGPILEAGVNGVMDENLISIVIDRLKGFQSGPYHSEDNQIAMDHFQAGLDALRARTKKREDRGVEGTHKV